MHLCLSTIFGLNYITASFALKDLVWVFLMEGGSEWREIVLTLPQSSETCSNFFPSG